MGRKIKIITVIVMVLYLAGRLPIPLLVIPLIGCTAIWVTNEIKEIRDENKNKSKKKKKVTKKVNSKNS